MSNPAPMPSYWALAEEVTHLHGHLDKLKAENAELRKELAVNEPLFETLNDANDGLLAENAELRELVRDMWHDARLLDANGHIDGMRLSDSKAEDYKRRMEELGVDV